MQAVSLWKRYWAEAMTHNKMGILTLCLSFVFRTFLAALNVKLAV
jgi:hypothetical protein